MPKVVDSPAEKAVYEKLLEKARATMVHAYCPISDFAVGAAAMTDDGKIYTGCNIENANVGGGMCAERGAFAKAISEGSRSFKVVAVVSKKAKNCWPCGFCRQFMREFGGEILVVVEGCDGSILCQSLDELVPMPVVPA